MSYPLAQSDSPQKHSANGFVTEDLILRATALLAAFTVHKMYLPPTTKVLLLIPVSGILAGSMLVFPSVLRHKVSWLFLSLAVWALILPNWAHVDNHLFLFGYWLSSCALSRWSENPLEFLRSNGRTIVGLCFLFATFWKVASKVWLDGSFFYFFGFFDPRIGKMVHRFVDPESWNFVKGQLQAMTLAPDISLRLELPTIKPLFYVARGVTYFALTLELLIAALFLFYRSAFSRVKDYLLMIFCVLTYAVAPVYGFGLNLSIMGLASCENSRRRVQILYVLLFAGMMCLHTSTDVWKANPFSSFYNGD
jgi:hypothetical protein